MEKIKSKKFILLGAIILVLTLGLSFAWYIWSNTGDNTLRLKGGSLKLSLDETSSNGIYLTSAIPQFDEQGLNNSAYTFKLINNSSVNVSYKLYLDDQELSSSEGSVRLGDNQIKYSLVKNSSDENPLFLSSTTNRVIDEGIINANTTVSYSLKIWIDIDATDIEGKVFKGKVRLEGVQTDEFAVKEKNPNILNVYKYVESENVSEKCLAGKEEVCEEITNINGDTEYTPGTIIKYKVNDDDDGTYFNVLHDDGDTLTLQTTQSIASSKWYSSNDSTFGPLAALDAVETATENWDNVNNFDYSIGDNKSSLGYSGCINYRRCEVEKYTLSRTDKKARLLIIQEAAALDCSDYGGSCKDFLFNYMYDAATYGGTFEDDTYYYWLMNTQSNSDIHGWSIYFNGGTSYVAASNNNKVRAVVEINK